MYVFEQHLLNFYDDNEILDKRPFKNKILFIKELRKQKIYVAMRIYTTIKALLLMLIRYIIFTQN